MARIRFCHQNLWSASSSVVVASSAAANLPAAASQNPDRSYVWRSLTAVATPTLDVDLGSVLAVSLVAIANPRQFSDAAVIELYQRGDAGTAGAATLVATLPVKDAETNVAYIAFASQSHRHWQLKWTNPGAVDGYVEAGYVFLGVPFEPAVNYTAPADGSLVDPSIAVASVDGQVTVTQRTAFRQRTLTFSEVAEADFDSLREVFETVGVRRNFFVIEDSTRSWTALLARCTQALRYREEDVHGRFSVQLTYEEAR